MPRHGHHDPAPPACCSCCCGCGYATGCAAAAPCYYPAPVTVPVPPSSAASDHLLHAIAAHLLLSSPAPAQPQPQPQPQPQTQPPPPPPAAHHAANPYPYPHPYQYQYQYHQQEAKTHTYAHAPAPPQPQPQHNPSGDHGHLLLHSLLRRVAALESALPGRFPAPPPPARRPPHPSPLPRRGARYQEDAEESESEPESPPPRQRRPVRAGPPSEASERAARTIQAHFRRFLLLARRSRTLRQLKELAVLRSKAAAIRGSLSGRRGCADPAAVSEAAMGLLLRLHAIQGGDPMIREGKRAVSRELSRILEFVDKVLVKEHEQMAMGDTLDADEYHGGCNAAFVAGHPSVSKKKVSFSGNGQVHELNGETDNGNVVAEDSESSSSAESDEVKGVPHASKKSVNGKPGLAAPTPVHMESRRIAGERR